MNVKPHGWNVVLLGRWNTAIFTPEWIAKRLFDLESGEMVEVAVSVDEALPHRLKVRNITVIPSSTQLVVAPQKMGYEELDAARKIAAKALSELKETPVAAVGFNIRFQIESPQASLLDSLAPDIDKSLSNSGHIIESRVLKRSLRFNTGLLNLSVTVSNDATAELEFNFHQGSQLKKELLPWLSLPVNDVQSVVEKLGKDVFETDLTIMKATKNE